MQCSRCGGKLVYDEYLNGMMTCPVENGVVAWNKRSFSGERHSQAIRCRECGQPIDREAMGDIIRRSVS